MAERATTTKNGHGSTAHGSTGGPATERRGNVIYADVGEMPKQMFDEMMASCIGPRQTREFVTQVIVALYQSWQSGGKAQFLPSQIAIITPATDPANDNGQILEQLQALQAQNDEILERLTKKS